MKKINNPLVSIVMPVYNADKYLLEAIESVLAQTYTNYELVIVDDVSTDKSWDIIKKFQKKYPKQIRAVKLKINTNAAGNGGMNAVYTQLKGKYIARMDADDIADPMRIEKQVKFMEAHPKAILVGTQAHIIDATGKITGKKTFPTSHEAIYKQYFVLHPILHPSVMFRKSLIPNKEYIYENKWGINDDYYTFFKFLKYGKFYNLPEALLYYRMHGLNFSLQNPKAKFINSIKIRLQAIREFGYRPSIKSVFLMLTQVITIPLIPESLIVPLYFAIRGIKHPSPTWISHLMDFSIKVTYKIGRPISSLPRAYATVSDGFMLALKNLRK